MTEHRLPEQLDIRRIGDAHRQLIDALSENATEVDASAVARIDTAGVQLLVSALAAPAGRTVTLADPAPCVIEAFEALGLEHLLNS